jgi:hypothetical protein
MIRVLIGAAVLLLIVPVAQADLLPNGDFESGGPAGLVKIGNSNLATSVGTGGEITPFSGSVFLAASTGGSATLTAGTGPASFFTGDPAGTGNDITQYSGVSFPFTLTEWSEVTVMMNFFTGEVSGGVPDIVAFYIDSGSGPVLVDGFVLSPGSGATSPFFTEFSASDFDGTSITDPIYGSFADGQTGYIPVTGELIAGTYTVYILVGDVSDTVVDSGFALDYITTEPVPEPGTWLLFGLGAAGLVGYRRRQRRKAKASA